MTRRVRVLLLAPYPLRQVPSQRFRFEQYLEPLGAQGIDVQVRPLLDVATASLLHKPGSTGRKVAFVARAALARLRDLRSAWAYDVVFVHREAFPLGYPWLEWLLKGLGRPYIYDFDDAIYMSNVSDANRRFAALKYPRKTEAIVRGAAVVLAGNQHLASWARRFNSRVRVVPTTIDTALYKPLGSRPAAVGGEVCVGWSGSTTTIAHLEPLLPALARVQRDHSVALRVIGDPSFDAVGLRFECLPWREESEVEDLSSIDIGIMPLPDDDWARGKCGLKALQYMALGIPTVMSPVGVNVDIARGEAAVLAGSDDDWCRVLGQLVEQPQLRAQLGVRGRARVEEAYSVTANVQHYAEAIRDVSRHL